MCSAPSAKRIRHEKWNGVPANYFTHNPQKPYFRPDFRFQNPYQSSVPCGKNGIRHFIQQNTGPDFGFDQSMRFPVSQYNGVRQPFKAGYSRKQSKRGNSVGSRFSDASNSEIKASVMEKLAASGGGGLYANDLARLLACQRNQVNRELYSMQREGLVDRVSERPPRWVLKDHMNAFMPHSSRPNSCMQQRSGMPAFPTTSLHSAQSAVSLRVQDTSREPIASHTMESFDIIPAVAITDISVPPPADVLAFAWSASGSKTAVCAENDQLSLAHDVDRVCQQKVVDSKPSSSSIGSDAPAVSFISTSDSSLHGFSNLLKTVPSEQKKPVGKGRGRGLLNILGDRLAKTTGISSVLASCEPDCDQMQHDANRFADDECYDSGIIPDFTKPQTSVCDDVNPANVNRFKMVKLSSGAREDQSSGVFRAPLPPKQLIMADPVYRSVMPSDLSFHSDISLQLRGNDLGIKSAQNQGKNLAADVESESYRSLPESLSALTFCPPSLHTTHSLDDLTKLSKPSCSNPFATALGIEDSASGSALSSAQMLEGAAGGLSLTSESFAALNKNAVSALMEYAQSRHVDVEIKCIGSFGPPHCPVYVSA